MHPLRFPNSGIRAKVFMRKIGLKLRVIILNRIESFYVLLLRFRSKDNKERGWLTTARPSGRVAGHGQAARGSPVARVAACKGGRSCRGSAGPMRRHPPARCRPRAAVPTVGAVAHADGVQHRRLRRAAKVVRVREEG
ncbi:hypothetical protein BHM03_00044183 [Ensete ventricosum]|nr:hypothetical protein BHM03_00044183 [Ensete ventricosum]